MQIAFLLGMVNGILAGWAASVHWLLHGVVSGLFAGLCLWVRWLGLRISRLEQGGESEGDGGDYAAPPPPPPREEWSLCE